MNRTRTASLVIAACLAAIPTVSALFDPGNGDAQGVKKFVQAWTPPATAHRSRVESCDNPIPMDRVALDDFKFNVTGTAVRLKWWGVLLDQNQIGRPYYIAIYSDANCQPDSLLYETCLVPQVQPIGIDCTNRKVFAFRTPIPAFQVVAGQHYWLQISENDADSANHGKDDFAWSGRQPVRFCHAVETNDFTNFQQLVDPCNQQDEDLSFEITVIVP